MWRLFEDFVTGFYEREQPVYRVNPGGRRIQWADPGWKTDADRGRIPVMEADVILESPERRLRVALVDHACASSRVVAHF